MAPITFSPGSTTITSAEGVTNGVDSHLRRRSSVTAFNTVAPFFPSPFPNSVHATPNVQHLAYNERTGEISLPQSPPLMSWKERTALGLVDDGARKSPSLANRRKSTNFIGDYHGPSKRSQSQYFKSGHGPLKGRPFAVPKPWIQVTALIGVTYGCFVLLSYLIPSATSYGTQAILSRMPFGTFASSCDPYTALGSLNVDLSDPDGNQWVPFDPTCKAPSFLAQLRRESESHHLYSQHHHHQSGDDAETLPYHMQVENSRQAKLSGGKMSNHPDFSWLHNRTALIIGDSISREHVENFCTLMGEESEVIRSSHKYAVTGGPSQTRAPSKASHVVDKPKRLQERGSRVVRDASLPRLCYIPKYDFMLISVFHFGVDQEDYWRDSRMPQYVSPGMFEHRLSDIVEPLMANLRADGRKSAPDYVEVTSGMWDLARWAELDIASEQDPVQPLTQERVTWFRFRAGQLMDKLSKTFPDAKSRSWRSMHYPLDQVSEHDYFMEKISPRSSSTIVSPPPPSFSHSRIYQLDQAVRSLMEPIQAGDTFLPAPHSEWKMNEWGPILKGRDAHQRDRLHGDPLPGGYLWGDIMLYELFRGMKDSEGRPMRKI